MSRNPSKLALVLARKALMRERSKKLRVKKQKPPSFAATSYKSSERGSRSVSPYVSLGFGAAYLPELRRSDSDSQP